ncbi:T9SS type A sorting domain-containing protein [Flavobacterium supellecticarium]|uniref:T9SS type A sorting domain-containing protein n=1 Tax=Flavobacterium supellecticarium TaxID=2565924 RepID=A0A4S3ZZC2_9FLAO|nr:T9SS type A sorting domain-containing protein [Flavobacterium supellecticarium]
MDAITLLFYKFRIYKKEVLKRIAFICWTVLLFGFSQSINARKLPCDNLPSLLLETNSITICSGNATPVVTLKSRVGDYDSYVWSPAAGVTGNVTTGWVFDPAETTTYTLTGSQFEEGCTKTITIKIYVLPNPEMNILEVPVICKGAVANLSVTTSGNVQVGRGQRKTMGFEEHSAFCSNKAQYWSQTVITAAELRLAGLQPGAITGIGYHLADSGNNGKVKNFSINMGTTPNTTLSGFVMTGLVQVFESSVYNYHKGWNIISFSIPYLWDGMSSIIIDIRQEGGDNFQNPATHYTEAENTTVWAATDIPSSSSVLTAMTPTPTLSKIRFDVQIEGQVITEDTLFTCTWTPGALTGASIAVSPSETTTYTVKGVNGSGCFTEKTVTVHVNATEAPEPPIGAAEQTINVGQLPEATIAKIAVVGENILWYATETDALSHSNPLSPDTSLINDKTYYAVNVADSCTSAPFAVTVKVALGTTSFVIPGLQYHPNPVTEKFVITHTDAIASVEVIDFVGKRVISLQPDQAKASVDMSALPAGIYMVKVQASGQFQSIKVIKNK